MMAFLVALVVGFWAAEYAGSITGSVWIAAGAGVVLALALGSAARFRREEEEEKWLNRADWLGTLSKMVVLGASLALASYAVDQIINSGPDELGFMDYGKPATGGWIIGILIFGIWTWAKSRKSDITQ